MSKIKVDPVEREVIERKLLAALDDESKVAIIATKDDLILLIDALECCQVVYEPHELAEHAKMHECLLRLLGEAFPSSES